MSKLLVYTFKKFPFLNKISRFSPFVFHKFREDFLKINRQIDVNRPNYIIGIAKSSKLYSQFETRAVNIFHGSKTVSREGKYSYDLDYPSNGYKAIKLNKKYTDSFCNWTTYKISEFVAGKPIKVQFVHINEKDIDDLINYLFFLKGEE